MNADNVITYWACSARCWQEGGPHGDDCRPTNYVRLDEGEWVGTDADRAVIDAAEVIKRAHDGAVGVPCSCSICVAVRARREAQT